MVACSSQVTQSGLLYKNKSLLDMTKVVSCICAKKTSPHGLTCAAAVSRTHLVHTVRGDPLSLFVQNPHRGGGDVRMVVPHKVSSNFAAPNATKNSAAISRHHHGSGLERHQHIWP